MAKNCDECKIIPIEIKEKNHLVIKDYQADLWKLQRVKLNLHQIVNKMI